MKVEVGFVVGKVSAFDMDALDSRIRELVAFARERDGEDRTTLFRSLVDMFLTGKAPVREPTRGQLLDVIEALIPHVEPDSRRTVAEILAGQSKPPMDLVRRLARDRAKLMEDMLVAAPFDEDDIIELIGATGREHHQILATRSDLSANVWIALARAAPSAPPFERQSSLALWRDDLGTQADTDDDTLHGEELHEIMEPRRAVAGGGGTIVASAGSDLTGTATITRLHPGGTVGLLGGDTEKKSASLRILKTDEDLIAERMGEQTPPPETKMVRGDAEDEAETTHNLTSAHLQADGDAAAKDCADETQSEMPRYLRDPGPGGWAWRSDRDGFITLVSPFAARLFGGQDRLLGTAMLDMLGLNTKLDHPVSRAFQRRSTIHDAPINLPDLGQNHQYWTLEAAPVFSASGGIFEGFEGILTPVVPASEEANNTDQGYDQPLFLDDDDRPEPGQPAAGRPSVLDQPSVMQTAVSAQPQDTPGMESRPALSNPLADMINSTAAAMVREAVADALNPLTPSEEEERFGATDIDAPGDVPASQATETPTKARLDVSGKTGEEIHATLALLEEALTRLTEAGQKGATAQVRLQSDIAAACLRALKQQLS